MDDRIIPPGTECDAYCPARAHVRVMILAVRLPVFLCAHHEKDFVKAMKKKPTLEYENEYNPVTV